MTDTGQQCSPATLAGNQRKARSVTLSAKQREALNAIAHGQVFGHGRDGNVLRYFDESSDVARWPSWTPGTVQALVTRGLVQRNGTAALQLTPDGQAYLSSEKSTDG